MRMWLMPPVQCRVHAKDISKYHTLYLTVMCEGVEYNRSTPETTLKYDELCTVRRVQAEYIDKALQYDVLCTVRRVRAEYTQTKSKYYVLCAEYTGKSSSHVVELRIP